MGWLNFCFETFFFLVMTILAADTTASYFFSFDIIPKADRGKNKGFLLFFVLIVFFVFLLRVLTRVKLYKLVSINEMNKTISLKNILTRHEQTLSFAEIDGYYDSVRSSSYGSHKEVLFIKNDKVISIISNEYNANYKDLLNSLSDLKYFGTLDYNLQDKTAMLFNKQI